MSFDAGDRLVWLDSPERGRGAAMVCEQHAGRLDPPRGWILRDRRDRAPRLWVDGRGGPAPADAGVGSRTARPPRRRPVSEPTPLPFGAAPERAIWPPAAHPMDLDHVFDAKSPLLRRAFAVVRAERDAS